MCSAGHARSTTSTNIIPTSFSSTPRESSSASSALARNGNAIPLAFRMAASNCPTPFRRSTRSSGSTRNFPTQSSLGSKRSPDFTAPRFDHLDGDSFNIPFVLGGTYIYSPEVQLVFGVGVNLQGRFPVLPGGGVRWKFSPNWVLNAVLPTPRLEYSGQPRLHALCRRGYQGQHLSDG